MPNDFTREEGELVGQIRPAPDDGKPLFRVIGRRDRVSKEGDENVRPCDHHGFILDRKWSTVTCEKCRQTISAFDAIMRYVEWCERLKSEQRWLEMWTRRYHVARLKDMQDRRALTDAERAEISDVIQREHKFPVDEIERLADRIRKALSQRKNDARQQRRERA
jgi:hypothetical protein